MDDDRWVNVDPRTKKLSIRFRVRGFSRQFYISTGLKDTKRNREIVRTKRDAIQTDIVLGRFDHTLESYQFRASSQAANKIAKSKSKKTDYDILQLWDKFTIFKTSFLEASTISNYAVVAKAISKLPTKSLSEAPKVREFLLNNYSYWNTRDILSHLSRCCDWGIESGLIFENPFKPLLLPKPKKSSEENLAAYTIEQRDLIIQSFENHAKFNHYANLIKFLFWTGCRPGESFALTWGDISHDCTRISISKSFSTPIGQTKGTKNGKKRIFPTAAGSKLQQLLLQMRPEQPKAEELIFKTLNGKRLTTRILDRVWRGHNVHEYCYIGVVKELAELDKLPYLKPYSTRHTFATWAISSGASPDKVAYWLGDNVQTILMYYCHPDVSKSDCPDF